MARTSRINRYASISPASLVFAALARGRPPRKYLVVLGYAAWGPGQLDGEMETGSWVVVPPAELPAGLRERVPIRLVVPPRSVDDEIHVFDGRTVGLPVDSSEVLGGRSVSVEVDLADAARVAAAERVRLVITDPEPDAAAGG